ncbi:hypothetical protein AGMMS49543_28530 [Betaproteobacteria bacterium]|nr:hypothetical protein AGMMS49543_28530 [Betaproteobacteria bacterium]
MLDEEMMEEAPQEEVSTEQVEEQSEAQVEPVAPQEPNNRSLRDVIEESAKKLEEEEAQTKEQPQQVVKPTLEAQKIDPMSQWNLEQKKFFQSLSPDGQRIVQSMFRNPAKAYEKATLYHKDQYAQAEARYKQVEPVLNEYKTIQQLFAKHAEDMKREGLDIPAYVAKLYNEADIATNHSDQFLAGYLSVKGIDPQDVPYIVEDYARRQNDPVFQRVERVSSWVEKEEARKEQQEREAKEAAEAKREQQEQIERQEAEERWTTFAQTVDEQGNPKYPYLDEVSNLMVKISEQQNEFDLDRLYNQAIWMNPEIRSKLIEMERQTAIQQQLDQTRVGRAKQAAKTSIKTSPRDTVVPQKKADQFGDRNLIEYFVDSAENS